MTERKGWTQNSPYEFIYPGGWSVTNGIINGKSRWTLLCAGEQFGAAALNGLMVGKRGAVHCPAMRRRTR
ncbi:hypothetical protein B0G76_8632 [Paraburkholderia sp. BL23I1N1]|uniref:hypothetical protein n=1 Tax=Paraburkholderia sp. BL23I1N1 TaxID=1938802 RepID=UPI000FF3C4B0|nr:hypothetical protein [Paraburkholderia sp. BL23I1N1]RKE23932.1 hypothetical protein B0G76_8632 [Paraburkholderia sp. BL23I1N1]